MAYATVANLQARIPYREISVSSVPTTAQVQEWLDNADATIDGALQAGELPAPYTDATAVRIIKEWVLDYVEGRVRVALASASIDGLNTDGVRAIDRWEARLADIHRWPDRFGAMLGAGAAPAASITLRAYSTDNNDGLSIGAGDFDPTFTREEQF